MTAHKVQLQFAQLPRVDANIGQLAKAAVDSIHSPVLLDDLFDDSSRCLAARSRLGGEFYLLLAAGNGYDLIES
jgi:hypothetical protein